MNVSPDRQDVAQTVLDCLRNKLFLDGVTVDTHLIESGLIDSVGFIRMFVVLEEEFGIEVTARDLSLERFQNVGSISRFVIEKLEEGGGSEMPVDVVRA
ncbi:acyl carrier protein [Streptomyces sp. 110]|uniref:Acyl carrier protein n=1 Tax=Streptomyces endocoffeicus TaxID=2898945 RepID=A0ABS1PS93_9ACTN|nr:acyl carrier protein [Streptomyces endocoffeicus]MBL1115005.1 acyl carrier protein [Streptomyces endocoffeicus]